MKNILRAEQSWLTCRLAVSLILSIFLAQAARADLPLPGGSSLPMPLDSWSFTDHSNWTDDYGGAPISFTNITWAELGEGNSLVMETNVPAWLNYPIYATNNATNIVVNGGAGSITLWYAGGWATTNSGPGEWAQLVDIGQWTSNSSVGYFGLSISPSGSNILFFSQDGVGDAYSLSAPISWTTNYFHSIILTYSQTNVSLYLDGQLATNDPGGLSIWPDSNVISGGVYFGSDMNGNFLGEGLFDWIQTYNSVLDSNTVEQIYDSQLTYFEISPWNIPYMDALSSAPSIPAGNSYLFTNSTLPDVITGPGDLQWDGILANWTPNANPYVVWITNVSAAVTNNGAMNLTFSVNGGQSGYMYDTFVTSALEAPIANADWAWWGQCEAGNTYTLTNIPSSATFLILGTPQSTTGNGLTDAYELLVLHNSDTNYSTDGTGMADGWEVLYFGHTGVSPGGDPDGDGLPTFQEWLMRSEGYNPVEWNTFTNSPVGDGYQNYSGDGLANLLQTSFGGNMLTNNPAWKENVSGDGLSDEYKMMVGLNPNTATTAPGLPSYNMNPIQ